MENRLKRIEIAVIVLLVISIFNLGKSYNTATSEDEGEVSEQKDLPIDLSKDRLNKIVYKVKTGFNRSNWDELYNIFGDYAKSQTSVEDVELTFKKLKSATGSINTYAYSHYDFKGDGDNADWFVVYYKCRFDNGKGTIKLSTRTVDDVSEIVGVKINLEEL